MSAADTQAPAIFDKELYEKAAEYTRLALPLMARNEIPSIPRNFAIWYEYAAGSNQSLREEINKLLNDRQAFTPSVSETLFNRYIALCDTHSMEAMQQDMSTLMSNTIGDVRDAGRSSGKTAQRLQAYLQSLEEQDNGEVRSAMQAVISEAQKIRSTSGDLESKLEAASNQLQRMQDELEAFKRSAQQDNLTRMMNRGAYEENLQQACEEAYEQKAPLSVLMLDIDRFKDLNKTHGFLAGDKVLKYIAGIINDHSRDIGRPARFSGNAFTVILPDMELQQAAELGDRIRKVISEAKLRRKSSGESINRISVSVGAAAYNLGESSSNLTNRVEMVVFGAKAQGGDVTLDEQTLKQEFSALYPKED